MSTSSRPVLVQTRYSSMSRYDCASCAVVCCVAQGDVTCTDRIINGQTDSLLLEHGRDCVCNVLCGTQIKWRWDACPEVKLTDMCVQCCHFLEKCCHFLEKCCHFLEKCCHFLDKCCHFMDQSVHHLVLNLLNLHIFGPLPPWEPSQNPRLPLHTETNRKCLLSSSPCVMRLLVYTSSRFLNKLLYHLTTSESLWALGSLSRGNFWRPMRMHYLSFKYQ